MKNYVIIGMFKILYYLSLFMNFEYIKEIISIADEKNSCERTQYTTSFVSFLKKINISINFKIEIKFKRIKIQL